MPASNASSRKGPSRLEQAVLTAIEEHRMLLPGQRVAVACSGGADSTALFELLAGLATRFGWVVSIAHFNHQLRGEESEQDAAFVRQLAATHGVPLHEAAADVGTRARHSRGNLEATARRLRYEFLRSLVASGQVDRIAVGHTADDQAETVLLRLIRGSGPQGLGSIRPTLPGGIIRPLLGVRGPALRQWLRQRGIGWREDHTNQDQRLRRNLLRHKLLPALQELNPAIVEALAQTARLAQLDEAFWSRYIRHLQEKHTRATSLGVEVEIAALRRLPPAAGYRLLKQLLEELLSGQPIALHASGATGPQFRQIQSLHMWAVRRRAASGQEVERRATLALPGNIEARRNFTHLILSAVSAKPGRHEAGGSAPAAGYRLKVTPPCQLSLDAHGLRCGFELIAPANEHGAYNGLGNVWLDAALLTAPLLLRNWQPGDAYRPAGRHKSRKLKELFQRHRVPIHLRAGWPVLESAGRIVWSRQFGPAAEFVATAATLQILRITVDEVAASNGYDRE